MSSHFSFTLDNSCVKMILMISLSRRAGAQANLGLIWVGWNSLLRLVTTSKIETLKEIRLRDGFVVRVLALKNLHFKSLEPIQIRISRWEGIIVTLMRLHSGRLGVGL